MQMQKDEAREKRGDREIDAMEGCATWRRERESNKGEGGECGIFLA